MLASINRDDRGSSGQALRITPFEQRALQMLANGHTTGDVAVRCGVGAADAEAWLADLFAAMGASTRVEAVAAARRRGLLV